MNKIIEIEKGGGENAESNAPQSGKEEVNNDE